ncbi:hypothetical protein [Pseudonocardia nigra]|uniref:hypothetical protein n=1 Tax=Pseudonocardia nigra TaxID=1921578 RepID=UPI001C605C9A|nr:hypothetical protein [Pseudonocardia nigra]
MPGARRFTAAVWCVIAAAVTSAAIVVLSAVTGVPGGERLLGGAYLDATRKSNLPTWWSTALLTTSAAGLAAACLVSLASRARDAVMWAVGAVVLLVMSLVEHTAVHARLALLLGSTGPLDGLLLVMGGAALGVMIPVAVGLGGSAGALVGAAVVLLVLSAVGGTFLVQRVSDRTPVGSVEHVAVTHAAELGENVGALLVLAAAMSAIAVDRVGGGLRVSGRRPPSGAGHLPPARRAAAVLVGVTAALSAASLVAVLSAPSLGPGFHEMRVLLDVLVEDNLPTWWSSTLLLLAALAHLVVAAVAHAAAAPAAFSWVVTALLLAALSLDDHTALHERTEVLARRVVDTGSYPFAWLVPGLLVGAAVAAAVVRLAVRTRGRPRVLLVLGIGTLLTCALGLEFAQGLLMQAGAEGLAFALLYHLEELGENIAALVLIAAAASALTVGLSGAAVHLGYIASAGFQERHRGRHRAVPARGHPRR